MKNSLTRTVIAGLAGGLALNLAMFLTFRLIGFGWQGGGVLLDPTWQSPKLIAVWTRLEPLPLVVVNPAPIIVGLMLFGLVHAFIYRWLSPQWPPGLFPRALRLGLLILILSFLFWGIFHPFQPVRRTPPAHSPGAPVLGPDRHGRSPGPDSSI